MPILTDEQLQLARLSGLDNILPSRDWLDTIDHLKAEVQRVHYGPGTQDEIKHLGEQVQELLHENGRLSLQLETAKVAAKHESEMLVHTLRSMAKNLKPEFAQVLSTAADAFEAFPRPDGNV